MSVAQPQDLIDMLSQMEFWRQEPPKQRKRAFKRFVIRGEATLEPVDTAVAPLVNPRVMLRDISRGSVGVLCQQYLDPGTVWRLAFEHHAHRVGTQPIVVRYCRLVQDGLYLVGGQFVIEPYLMVAAGVDEAELAHDIRDRQGPDSDAAFVTPDQVDDFEG